MMRSCKGYTIVELMVTSLLVVIVATVIGIFAVRIVKFRDDERDRANVRNALADICGSYADFMSVADSVVTPSGSGSVIHFPCDVGGVSLETGLVSRASKLVVDINDVTRQLDMDFIASQRDSPWVNTNFYRLASVDSRLSSKIRGLLKDGRVEIEGLVIKPLGLATVSNYGKVYRLVLKARYGVRYWDREYREYRYRDIPVSVERMVRLWNRE